MSDADAEAAGGERHDLPADPAAEPKPWEMDAGPAESFERAADGVAAFRRLLTEVAKVIGVFALIFLAIVVVVLSCEFVQFVMEVL